MGVAGNTTDLKLADTVGKRAKARGTLAQWNERRAVLQGQHDAFINEMAQLDAVGHADLGGGAKAHIDKVGNLLLGDTGGHWCLPSPEAALALRDHLCNVLGLPDRFQDLAELVTLSREQALCLAAECVHRTGADGRNAQLLRANAVEAIMSALDHVGVIQSDTKATPSATRQADGGKADVTTKPQASAPAAGTAGSAQNPNAASEDWESLHGVNVDSNSKDAKPARASTLGANKELARATDAMLSIVDQFTALIYRLTNHDAVPKSNSHPIDLQA